jgi:hypothetical protein
MTQPTQAANPKPIAASDTAARIAKIQSKFLATEDPEIFTCDVNNCKAKIRCYEKRGCAGRQQHLKRYHVEEYNACGEARQRYKKPPSPEGTNPQVKKEELEKEAQVPDDELAELFCRKSYCFKDIEDPFWQKRTAMKEKQIRNAVIDLAEKLRLAHLRRSSGSRVAITMDGGTNARIKS